MKASYSKDGFPELLRARDVWIVFTLPVLSFMLLLFVLPDAGAVPASPEPVEFSQSDGSGVKVFLKGDEFYDWLEDEGGYTIIKDTDTENWFYAEKDDQGSLKKTVHKAGRADPAKLGLRRHLLDDAGVSAARAGRKERDNSRRRGTAPASSGSGARPPVSSALPSDGPQSTVITSGTMKNLVILARFSDQSTTYTQAQFDSLFNQAGYAADGAVGSVKDFYTQVSYGKLTMQSTVSQWVNLPNTAAYYGAGKPDANPRQMVIDAINALDAAGFDFSTMDGNGDGEVDGLDIIHSGRGAEFSGNSSDYIWSHQWQLASAVTKDGVRMSMYHTEPEVRGWDSIPASSGITRIGVICHETAHFLGLPDLYDYGGDSQGAGKFCLMADGSWNYVGGSSGNMGGNSPAHPGAYNKKRLGWVSPVTLGSDGTYSLARVEDSDTAVYKFSGAGFAGTEYFLAENKQNSGFDAGLPGTTRGMLIWHVDETIPDYGANDDQTRYKVDLEEAGGVQHLELDVNGGDDNDYFRSTTQTSFGDNTTPGSRSYAGVRLYWYMHNISASGNPMTFDLSAADITPPDAIAFVYDGTGADISYTAVATQLSANWTPSGDVESGIFRYWYAIGTTSGGTEKLGWTDNGTNLSVTRTGLSLTGGQIYYVSVKAENYQGLFSGVTTSDGQTVDTSAPLSPGTVNDGIGADISYTVSGTQLSANWTASSDAESGIAKYWYAIGTTAGGTEVTGAWTDNAASTSVTRTGLSLTRNRIYYFTVKAENRAGLKSSAANSNGQRVDNTPLNPAFTQAELSGLTAVWTAIPGAEYYIALSSGAGFINIISSGQQSGNSAVFGGLSAGTRYYFEVRVSTEAEWECAANRISSATLALIPDLPPGPVFTQVYTTGMTVNWSSGSAAAGYNPAGMLYKAQLSPVPGFDPVSASSQTYNLSAGFTGLTPDTTYYAGAQAVNQSGIGTEFAVLGSTLLPAAMPGLPAGAVYTEVCAGSMTVNWSSGAVATGYNPVGTLYKVEVSTAPGFNPVLDSSQTYDLNAGFAGLTPNTTYYARAQAIDRGGVATSFLSAPGIITQAALPLGGQPSGIGASSITANWSANGNPVWTRYTADISSDDFSSVTGSSGTMNNNAVFTGLFANTTYYFRARANNNNGQSTAWVTLPPARTRLSAPGASGAAFPAVGVSSAAAQWTSGGNGQGTLYLCQISTDNFLTLNFTSATYSLSALFGAGGAGPDLRANTTHYFRVRAGNGETSTADVPLGSTVTLAYVPGATTVLAVTSVTASLDWLPDGNPEPGTRYEVWRDTQSGFTGPVKTAVAASELLIDGLAAKTTYYFKVRAVNLAGVFSGFNAVISTGTYPAPPGAFTLTGAALGVSSINWTWNDAGDEDGYRIISSTGGIISGGLAAELLYWPETDLSTNTVYARKAAAFNISGGSTSTLAARYTLAAPPADSMFTGVYFTSAAVQWSGGTNPAGTNYEVRYWAAGGSTSTVTAAANSAVLTGLPGGLTVYAEVRAFNGDNIPTSYDVTLSTLVPATVETISPNENTLVAYQGPSGEVSVSIPQNTFSETVKVTVRTPAPQDCPLPTGDLKALAAPVCVEIKLDKPVQPAKNVEISLSYRDGDLGGADKNKLVVARYDNEHSVWVPLFSSRDAGSNKVRGESNHFSIFQIMQSTPTQDLSNVTIGPNILRPGRDPGQSMTFRNLPEDARVRIYTLVGELLHDTAGDGTGIAVWNGRNQAGKPAASGIYIALIEAGGKKKVFRVAVER